MAEASNHDPSPAANAVNENLVDQETALIELLQALVRVLMKGLKIGTTIQEVFDAAAPYVKTDEEKEGLVNLHAQLQTHAALELLLGEDYHSPTMTLEQFLAHAGLTKEDLTRLPIEETLRRLYTAPPPPGGPFRDRVYEAADLLFEQRYGWKPGTAKTLTHQQLWLAIENALEDEPADPNSIWKLTS
jgi:hypothetical protein